VSDRWQRAQAYDLAMRAPRITVVGSCNVDIAVFVERAPRSGETVSGLRSTRGPGGKGANQAIAAARLGGEVSFVGAVGADAMGDLMRSALVEAAVDVAHLRTAEHETGAAYIVVEAGGANRIVVVAGANGSVTSLSAADRRLIAGSDLMLVQLELPLAVVVEASQAARAAGTRVILTPAPVVPLPDELVAAVDVLVPNQHEALQLADAGGIDEAIAALSIHVPDLVVTLGGRGGIHVGADSARHAFSAPAVEAVDTTAAGDTFVGALAVALGQGQEWPLALERAAAAAAISVSRVGASASMPSQDELERFLGRASQRS
jgi:ribokinase